MSSTWQPTASFNHLQLRAKILQQIRDFFAKRNVLEVDTPALSIAAVTDPHLHSFTTSYLPAGGSLQTYYLQTSPEFAMKRLLAAGSGAIYQICKAFRNDEYGRYHNPEFTLLEWYRPGFDHHDLMTEMDQLLQLILSAPPAERISYQALFEQYLAIDPHTISLNDLQSLIAQHLSLADQSQFIQNRTSCLQLLMNQIIEPKLGFKCPVFVYDFPKEQAALAKLRYGQPTVAERFEVYINGIELANGFHELSDANEQQQRFLNDLTERQQLNYSLPRIDENLLAALTHGLPDCAGVALGIDRLIMIATQAKHISEIITFPWDRA